jgi:hypothetical protein
VWDPRSVASGRIHRKHRFLYCGVLTLCCRDVFTAQLHSNTTCNTSRIVAWCHSIRDAFLSSAACVQVYLATAVSLPPQVLRWANTPQYCHVTIYGVWIGNWIYWTLTDLWQVIISVSLIHTLYSSLEHTLKSSKPAVSSPVFWRTFPSSRFPNCSQASATAILDWLTGSRLVLFITSRHRLRRKHHFSLLLYPIVVFLEICLFLELLLSNGCCIFAYFVAVA